ncbi:MAG: hypothetical protein PHY44_04170 [Lachnospiraceae bacterium]|nr:hypothetical protein [Lachnospiraceae bacterium]
MGNYIYFQKPEMVNLDSRLYKQAENSVNVILEIAKRLPVQ